MLAESHRQAAEDIEQTMLQLQGSAVYSTTCVEFVRKDSQLGYRMKKESLHEVYESDENYPGMVR